MKNLLKYFMIAIVFIDFVGVSMAVTTFPSLMLQGSGSLLSPSYSNSKCVILLGILISMYPFGQFFGASLFGKLSDSKGRKPILFVTILGTMVATFLCGLSITYSCLWALFLGRVLSGFFAGNVAVSQASIIDISSEQEKSSNIGLLQAIMGIGWIVGPVIASFFSNHAFNPHFNIALPFYIVAFVLLILLVATVFLYKETNLNKVPHVKINFFESITTLKKSYSNKNLFCMYMIWAVFACGWMLFEQYLPTFYQEKFHFSIAHVGYFMASMGGLYALSNFLIGKPFNKLIHPYTAFGVFGIVSGVFLLLIGVGSSVMLSMAFAYVFCVSCVFTIPGIMVSTSKQGADADQGQIMGVVNSLQALATILMALLGGFFMSTNSSFNVVFGGAFILLSWLMFVFYRLYAKSNNCSESVEKC